MPCHHEGLLPQRPVGQRAKPLMIPPALPALQKPKRALWSDKSFYQVSVNKALHHIQNLCQNMFMTSWSSYKAGFASAITEAAIHLISSYMNKALSLLPQSSLYNLLEFLPHHTFHLCTTQKLQLFWKPFSWP